MPSRVCLTMLKLKHFFLSNLEVLYIYIVASGFGFYGISDCVNVCVCVVLLLALFFFLLFGHLVTCLFFIYPILSYPILSYPIIAYSIDDCFLRRVGKDVNLNKRRGGENWDE